MEHNSTVGADQDDTPSVEGIPVDGIEAAYDTRNLDALSDDELVSAVAAVVATPREEPANSFVLHSPLELTARARLLARTPAPHRKLARLRLVSIAARYQEHAPADLSDVGDPSAEGGTGGGTTGDTGGAGSTGVGVTSVLEAIDAGDLKGVDAAVQRLVASRPDPTTILGPLAAGVATRTAAAAHGPIFLATLAEAPEHAPGWLPLLRPLTRELARRPDWAIAWMDRTPPTTTSPADPDALFTALADPPRLGVPGSSFIHPLLLQVDEPGVADAVLGPIVGSGGDGATAITRVAALAMVRDDPSHAPYGWTHCLTLPQAILTLAPHIDGNGGAPSAGSALAVAATQVLAFRAAQGSVTLDPNDELLAPADPATTGARTEALIVEAARRHDAHIAKYILASLTAAATDPEASELHLTAAEHLLAVWDDLGPDPDEVLTSAV